LKADRRAWARSGEIGRISLQDPEQEFEALGLKDDSRVRTHDQSGATPPNVYELEPREQLFHGVQALRLKPVGCGDIYGRTGLLAHTYMLGPNGNSNGCVSFKNYNSFLQAFQNGEVKRLVVVAR
jgi:hypothetical protein